MAKGSKGPKGSKIWTILSTVSALGAATVARKALDKGWQVSTRRKPPGNPADPDVALWEAVAWSAATGAAVALARMFAQRRAANYYVKSAGHLPPQLEKDED
ncbi:DUF4235 domain-containing protein [Nocardioides sp. CER19]|uniref:DUF4235 domain-containing protein n=1 Tax=Nocardioides sp. CER19 TaxID=3038538 RepID=UPI0024495FFA|nr:DUF4235 domain-containing protein [Nocardioides sp. CER19]MDH2416572.1 DUF4235 domain-containing protein [Nocardioides sp. CER19]